MMRILAVDDEPLAREALQRVLQSRQDVEAFDIASDGMEALKYLDDQSYDILLVDIHMPQLSGTELVDRIRQRGGQAPAVIFVTAFDEHAVQAFEQQAVDYILKPFTTDRVHQAIDNARRRTQQDRAVMMDDILPRLEMLMRIAPKIAIKTKGRVLFIAPTELISAKAEGNYVLLQLRNGSHLLREQISVLADKLRPYGFIRIHRSVLINTSYVSAMEPLFTGEYLLRMKDGVEFNVTRTYKKNLRELAHFWIGADVEPVS
jgi:two-component system, LytTR family, response regulator